METEANGPEAYLETNFPMLAGRLSDTSRLEVRVFGLSVVGGDLKDDPEYRNAFLDGSFDESGWVAVKDPDSGKWLTIVDVTLSIVWVVGP
jgi:hypothetical protein